ncbi:MAG: rod shape-determining protein MreC [Alphaproteobacteria bacterium]|nr:rod shape-determining protein MreC [Alphaproteobacteria bacterium]
MAFFVRHKKPSSLKPIANPYPSRLQRWRHSLGLSFILIIIVGGLLRFYSPFYEVIQQRLFEVTAWVQGMAFQPFQETHALLKNTHTFMYLKEEYARLQKENETLRSQLQTLKALKHENGILRTNLKIPAFETYGHITARIISTPYDGLKHFFLIAAGHHESVGKDQAVIVPEGVVGRIEKVGEHIARVLLINDVSSRIPVMTSLSGQQAILAGDGSFSPTLVYVEDIRQIQKGEEVVTSGFGGIFPPGLPVGIVDNVVNGKITVKSYIPFQKLEWVHVLKPNFEDFHKDMSALLEEE